MERLINNISAIIGKRWVEDKRITSNAWKWLHSSRRWGLLLTGGIGTGKTTLAKALLRTYLRCDVWLYPPNIKELTANEAVRIASYYPARWEEVLNSEFLIIDDIGTEPTEVKSYGMAITPIQEVLQYRYEKRSKTILTSNLSAEEIASRYGERVADRFKEMFAIIHFTGESWRK